MSELFHIGTYYSGRYPRGSGDDPDQHASDFLSEYRKLHAQGVSDLDIAKGFKISTTELRAKRSMASDEERAYNISRAMRLKEHGNSNIRIGELMNTNESTVRNWLRQAHTDRVNATKKNSRSS